jgi:hypothetical protein
MSRGSGALLSRAFINSSGSCGLLPIVEFLDPDVKTFALTFG